MLIDFLLLQLLLSSENLHFILGEFVDPHQNVFMLFLSVSGFGVFVIELPDEFLVVIFVEEGGGVVNGALSLEQLELIECLFVPAQRLRE